VGQWSWAGFIFNWLYLLSHNITGYGIGFLVAWVVLSFVPFLNFIAYLVIMIFSGIKGHEIVWGSGFYRNADEFVAAHRPLNAMGKIAFIVAIILIILFVILYAVIGAAMLAAFKFLGLGGKAG